jgi:hypothetical protein
MRWKTAYSFNEILNGDYKFRIDNALNAFLVLNIVTNVWLGIWA